MNTLNTTNTENSNISDNSRAARLLIGIILIAETMSTQGPLGLMAVLPLLAIYPIFSGITGWDPLKALFQQESFVNCMLSFPQSARTALMVLGIAMLSPVFLVSGAPGWLILLPLAAIYPIYLAMVGQEPVTAIQNVDMYQRTKDVSTPYIASSAVVSDTAFSENTADPDQHDLAA